MLQVSKEDQRTPSRRAHFSVDGTLEQVSLVRTVCHLCRKLGTSIALVRWIENAALK